MEKTLKDYWSTVVEGGKTYHMGDTSYRVYALKLLAQKGVKSLLDIGCGTGPIYQMWMDAPLGKYLPISEYKGVDPSPDMIKVCNEIFPDASFEVQNGTDLKELDNSWDGLLYMHSFDYMYDYKKAISEMYRVTKKYVCIVLWQPLKNHPEAEHGLNNSKDGKEEVNWDTAHLQHFAWEQLVRDFEEVGFKVLLKKDDEEVNKERDGNTVILLEKI